MRGMFPAAVLEAYRKMLNQVRVCSTTTNVWIKIQLSNWWGVDQLVLHFNRQCRIRLANYPLAS